MVKESPHLGLSGRKLSSVLPALLYSSTSQCCQIFQHIIKENWVKSQGCNVWEQRGKCLASLYTVSLMKLKKCRCIHSGKLLNNHTNMDEPLRSPCNQKDAALHVLVCKIDTHGVCTTSDWLLTLRLGNIRGSHCSNESFKDTIGNTWIHLLRRWFLYSKTKCGLIAATQCIFTSLKSKLMCGLLADCLWWNMILICWFVYIWLSLTYSESVRGVDIWKKR